MEFFTLSCETRERGTTTTAAVVVVKEGETNRLRASMDRDRLWSTIRQTITGLAPLLIRLRLDVARISGESAAHLLPPVPRPVTETGVETVEDMDAGNGTDRTRGAGGVTGDLCPLTKLARSARKSIELRLAKVVEAVVEGTAKEATGRQGAVNLPRPIPRNLWGLREWGGVVWLGPGPRTLRTAAAVDAAEAIAAAAATAAGGIVLVGPMTPSAAAAGGRVLLARPETIANRGCHPKRRVGPLLTLAAARRRPERAKRRRRLVASRKLFARRAKTGITT